jgi:uncharacterized NAD-dependent epimerase/dehydratase family protein
MSLIDLVYPKYKTISIVGTSKNAGKTVAMNQVIAEAAEKDIILGLVSTGRDGERRDVLTNTEKPPVYAVKGTIITTVENSLGNVAEDERAGIELLEVTGYNTPMGKVVLGKVLEAGYVEISGPRSSATIGRMCDMMQSAGAELVLIDGSLDRRASAAPFVSEGAIIAAGASLSRSMETIVQKTKHIVDLYSISRADAAVMDIAVQAIENKETVIVDEEGCCKVVGTQTSLNCGAAIAEMLSDNSKYVILSGSATFDTLKDIVISKKNKVQIVIKDATRVFINENEFFMLNKMGMDIKVIEAMNIIAITVNPYSPEGYYFEPEEFLRKMREEIKNIPVLDVMQEGC